MHLVSMCCSSTSPTVDALMAHLCAFPDKFNVKIYAYIVPHGSVSLAACSLLVSCTACVAILPALGSIVQVSPDIIDDLTHTRLSQPLQELAHKPAQAKS